jgi:hypothetical protein
MEEEKSLKQEIGELKDLLVTTKNKDMKLPRKAKLSKARVTKGYISAAVVRDNKNIDFVTTELIDGSYKIDNDTYHYSDEDSIYFYKGKPFVFQPKKRLNPVNMLKGENQTYGQKVVMSRMIHDTIKPKNQLGMSWLIWVIVIGVGAYLLLK